VPERTSGTLAETLEAVSELLDQARAAAGVRPEPLPISRASPLGRLSEAFGLSDFERGILALAIAVELVPGIGRKFAALDGEGATERGYPTFGRALFLLAGGHWDAFAPSGALRLRRLIALGEGEVLTERAVRIEERVLHALMGIDALDARLARRVRAVSSREALPPAHEQTASDLADALSANPETPLYLAALAASDALMVVARAAARKSFPVYVIDGAALPADAAEREELLRLWQREALLTKAILVVDLEGCIERNVERAALDFVLRVETPTVLLGREALPSLDRPLRHLEVPPLRFEERLELWNGALEGLPRPDARELAVIAAHFRSDAATVRDAAAELRVAPATAEAKSPAERLWQACRARARPRLGTLAQRVDSEVELGQVVLPEPQRAMLDALLGQVRHKAIVHHEWGFGAGEPRGKGVAALFAGPSGTGKTMAAEALATALRLDLYRVDLSAVVSKYIGETEQNLRRVFDAAEAGGAVLLFDEADALFGKRTEVKDSHDRHANIEVSYLLQRMEAYGGLALLTSNLRKNIDEAFYRRIPFVVDFPFPEAKLRERIWSGIFPPKAPLDALDFAKLARLSVAGGNIRSIAQNAAFLAASARSAISMKILLQATRLEYAKLARSLPSEEIRGWE
jgi:hypothetical protein